MSPPYAGSVLFTASALTQAGTTEADGSTKQRHLPDQQPTVVQNLNPNVPNLCQMHHTAVWGLGPGLAGASSLALLALLAFLSGVGELCCLLGLLQGSWGGGKGEWPSMNLMRIPGGHCLESCGKEVVMASWMGK